VIKLRISNKLSPAGFLIRKRDLESEFPPQD
jgi:hypothetical protein